MNERISMMNVVPAKTSPADVEFFDPPMCCPTGLCGPTLDQTLLDVNEMILALQRENLRVERYQMSSNPKAFLGNAEVMRLVRENEMKGPADYLCAGQGCQNGNLPENGRSQSNA